MSQKHVLFTQDKKFPLCKIIAFGHFCQADLHKKTGWVSSRSKREGMYSTNTFTVTAQCHLFKIAKCFFLNHAV
ncbi:hypothetical protein CJZ71_06015 [Bacillus subtilis]|nr:hypothetical protein CJZ70_05110 [Bacillus subtilis]AYK71805.1 hypothetical protein D9C09_19765 [Bacillus subtilis subsp. subtilis]KAA0938306.1 hypothetical protein FQ086_11850 [Bacillus sp. ANT_WA51]NOV06357.1 hypothetical protein [Bacillus sp. seq1]ASV01784.1 hypothetical protein CJZ71_06015 [Bacillus subtilis]